MKISIDLILFVVAVLLIGTIIWALCTDVRIPRTTDKKDAPNG
ncbi:MAG: hypothetical protein U0516_02410 [Candidatus Saccharibacteria bacterium]